LRNANPLDAAQRVKVSRKEVRQILLRSLWLYPRRAAWMAQFPLGKLAGKAVASGSDLP
jgi:hypothetical protein